jgi:hypothetical protein
LSAVERVAVVSARKRQKASNRFEIHLEESL